MNRLEKSSRECEVLLRRGSGLDRIGATFFFLQHCYYAKIGRSAFLFFSAGRVWLTWLTHALHHEGWRGGLGAVIAFFLSVLVAHATYQLYEKPFLRFKKRFTIVPS